MGGVHNALRGVGLLALAVGLSTAAHTQTLPPSTANTAATQVAAVETPDGEIVVTANKRAQNLNDVGLSVKAMSSQTLSDRRITSVQDIAAAVPGLKFAESGTGTPGD